MKSYKVNKDGYRKVIATVKFNNERHNFESFLIFPSAPAITNTLDASILLESCNPKLRYLLNKGGEYVMGPLETKDILLEYRNNNLFTGSN